MREIMPQNKLYKNEKYQKIIKIFSLVNHLSLQIWKQLLVAPVATSGYRLHARSPRAGHSPIPVWVVQGNRTQSLGSCLVGGER